MPTYANCALFVNSAKICNKPFTGDLSEHRATSKPKVESSSPIFHRKRNCSDDIGRLEHEPMKELNDGVKLLCRMEFFIRGNEQDPVTTRYKLHKLPVYRRIWRAAILATSTSPSVMC
ncbi:hypothetical protein CRM22_005333 [Opisthorchis felineus]|uniref:Uncharacterized protein n=1 Tax=Opisthorchis felineus TaxID=147828 RepID=A0A4S2LYF7_OPIFE|nr:hypothetical protein CRM22_005333 [Opisthorchis felineus]